MPLATVEKAIEDYQKGRMVIIVDDEDRENEGDLTVAAALTRWEAERARSDARLADGGTTMAGKFDLNMTTLGQLLDDPEARAIIDELVPELPTHPMVGMAKGMPVNTVLTFAGGQVDPEIVAQLKARISVL